MYYQAARKIIPEEQSGTSHQMDCVTTDTGTSTATHK